MLARSPVRPSGNPAARRPSFSSARPNYTGVSWFTFGGIPWVHHGGILWVSYGTFGANFGVSYGYPGVSLGILCDLAKSALWVYYPILI